MQRLATFVSVLFLAACGAAPLADVQEDALTASATLGPQSFTQGKLSTSKSQIGYAVSGTAGDIIAPDLWPTEGSALTPTLALYGPKSGGRRALVASGEQRGSDPRHLAIDGFKLPKTGSYLLVIGLASGNAGGAYTLRLWEQSSHLPRQEGSQADLTLTPSSAATAALEAHAASPHPWTDAEVGAVVADMLQQGDTRVALSTAQNLLSALSSEEATAAQRTRAGTAAAQIVGTVRHFKALAPQTQAFALWWLGNADTLLFSSAHAAPPQSVDDTVAQLIAAWPGAQEIAEMRTVQAKVLGGVVYGWQVEWWAAQTDVDGTQVWVDFSREWFDSSGHWLAEQSLGASEPDDD